jgi:hypothetical protein
MLYKKALLPVLHYSEYAGEKTVFGRPSSSPYGHAHLKYVSNDRLYEYDPDKAVKASNIARQQATTRTCRFYEIMLSNFYDATIEIEHIIAGINRGNGFPYYIFGYKEVITND